MKRNTGNPSEDYEVGYRHPPKEHQFKKGRSPNPTGRPKGRSDYLADLRRALSTKIVVSEDGKRKRMSMYQLVVRQALASAIKGDPRFMGMAIKLPFLLPEYPNEKGNFTLIIEGE